MALCAINSQIHFNYTLNKSDLSIKNDHLHALINLTIKHIQYNKTTYAIPLRLTTALWKQKQKKTSVQQNEHKISTCPKGHLERIIYKIILKYNYRNNLQEIVLFLRVFIHVQSALSAKAVSYVMNIFTSTKLGRTSHCFAGRMSN